MSSNGKKKAGVFKAFTLITQVAIYMLTPIAMCLFGGMWLDKQYTGTHVWTLVLTFFGIGAGFRNAYIQIMKQVPQSKAKKDDEQDKDLH